LTAVVGALQRIIEDIIDNPKLLEVMVICLSAFLPISVATKSKKKE
jgi:hypothetical protein